MLTPCRQIASDIVEEPTAVENDDSRESVEQDPAVKQTRTGEVIQLQASHVVLYEELARVVRRLGRQQKDWMALVSEKM